MKIEIKDIIYINKIGKWILLLLPLFLFSCTEDSNGSGSGDSDGTAIIRLTVRPNDATQVTRTSSSTESKVSNLYILVFNSSGKVVGTKYSSTTDTTVSITTRQGTNYTIYAVANTGNSAFFQGVGTLTQFKKMLTTVDVNTYPLMCGSLSGQSVSQSSVTIGGLKLTRLFAKVTLNVTAAAGITITGYQFCNVATSAYLDRDTVAGITWANKTAVTASSISGVTYYMYGNPQGTVTHTDQKNKAQSAPVNASYLLITAQGKSSSQVTYKIYLGSDNVSDYNVLRNYSYTYNITLNSLYSVDTRVTLNNVVTQVTSNCYIMNPVGDVIGIPVSRANEDGTTRLSSTTSGWTCGLVWTDNSNGLSSSGAVASIVADVANGRIIVTSGNATGNAVVYVKDSSGNIAWSWHIWVLSYDPDNGGKTWSFNGFTWMDRDLGATTAVLGSTTTMGLLYQWGRKDPFPDVNDFSTTTFTLKSIYSASGTVLTSGATGIKYITVSSTNNLNNSIQNPLIFYYNGVNGDWYSTTTQNGYLWGGGDITLSTPVSKTVYDPCPYGWRVPPYINSSSPWNGLTTGTWNNGYDWSSVYAGVYSQTGWIYPIGSNINFDINGGNAWSAAPFSDGGARGIYFTSSNVYPNDDNSDPRCAGFPVRCVKQ